MQSNERETGLRAQCDDRARNIVTCAALLASLWLPAGTAHAAPTTAQGPAFTVASWSGEMAPAAGNRPSTIAVNVHFFKTGTNGRLLHSYDGGATWDDLGGSLISQPAALSRYQGGIDIVAVGSDRAMKHLWCHGACRAPNDGSWGPWENLGGTFHDGRDASGFASAPSLASFSGRLDVFARGADAQLWHKYWTGTAWTSWTPRGGTLTSGPASISRYTGGIDIVALGVNAQMLHTWCHGACGAAGDGSWGYWEDLGGVFTSAPTVASWASSRLDIFGRGGDSGLYHKYWNGSSWNGWLARPGFVLTAAPTAIGRSPSASPEHTNRLDVFVGNGGSAIYVDRYADGTWTGYHHYLAPRGTGGGTGYFDFAWRALSGITGYQFEAQTVNGCALLDIPYFGASLTPPKYDIDTPSQTTHHATHGGYCVGSQYRVRGRTKNGASYGPWDDWTYYSI